MNDRLSFAFGERQRLRRLKENALQAERELHLRNKRLEDDRHAAREAQIAVQFSAQIEEAEADLFLGLHSAEWLQWQHAQQAQPKVVVQRQQQPTGTRTQLDALTMVQAPVLSASEHTVPQPQAFRPVSPGGAEAAECMSGDHAAGEPKGAAPPVAPCSSLHNQALSGAEELDAQCATSRLSKLALELVV